MANVLLVNLSSLPLPGNDPIYPIGCVTLLNSLERDGHSVALLDFVLSPGEQGSHLLDQHWDVVGFSVRNIDPIDIACGGFVDGYESYVSEAAERLPGSPLLVGGGPGFGLFAEYLTEHLQLDVGVRGVGEVLISQMATNPVPYRRRGVLDGQRSTDFLDYPVRHPTHLVAAYRQMKDASVGVETKRKTCYQGCAYCPYAYVSGENDGDERSPELLDEEIDGLYDLGVRKIFFTDAIFNAQLGQSKPIARMLATSTSRRPDLQWSAYFTPRPFDDELAELLSGSPVGSIVISPDSLDPGLMVTLGKTFDQDSVINTVRRCRRYGLRPMVNLVFGAPGESEETVRNTAEILNEYLDEGEVSLHVGYRVLPGTGLSRMTDLEPIDLVAPTFYPFDDDLVQWILRHLDSRFISTSSMLNLMAGRASAKAMDRLHAKGPTTESTIVAIRRAPATS